MTASRVTARLYFSRPLFGALFLLFESGGFFLLAYFGLSAGTFPSLLGEGTAEFPPRWVRFDTAGPLF